MRPAVHASILRNRTQPVRRVMRPHTFSMRRLMMMIFAGSILLVPGLTLSIFGLEKAKENGDMPTGKIQVYQAVGPAFTTFGVVIMFGACMYYFCYGVGESNRLPGGSHQSSINSDQPHHHHSHHGQHGHHDHRNGHQLHKTDGSSRKNSFREEKHSPLHSPFPQTQEDIPLAPITSGNAGLCKPPEIRVDEASEGGDENEDQGREPLVNGTVPHDNASSTV